MLQTETTQAVFGPFREMWTRILNYLPNLAAGLLILLFGLVVCWLVKRAVVRILLLMRLDRRLGGFSWATGFAQADVRHAFANTVGNVLAAFVFLIFFANAVVVWRLEILGQLIGGLVFYLPKLIVGIIILLTGVALAGTASGRIRAGLSDEGFTRAALVGRLVHWALMVVVVAFTLEELGIAPHLLRTAFSIGLGSLGIVGALAIGLGSRDAVAQVWRSILDRRTRES